MLPDDVEVFEHGNITLEIHHFEGLPPKFWVGVGISYLEFKEEDFNDLVEMLSSYKDEEIDYTVNYASPLRIASGFILLLVVVVFGYYLLEIGGVL